MHTKIRRGTVTAVLALIIGAVGLCFNLAAAICFIRYAAEDGGLSGSALTLLSSPFVGISLLFGVIAYIRCRQSLQKWALAVSLVNLVLLIVGVVTARCLY